MKLDVGVWWDDDTEYCEESCRWIELLDEKDNVVWSSSWIGEELYDQGYREKCISQLREETEEACKKYKVKADLSSDVFWNWRLI